MPGHFHPKGVGTLVLLFSLSFGILSAWGMEERDPEAWIARGKEEYTRMTCQSLERAVEYCHKAVSLKPDSPSAHAWLGRACGHWGGLLRQEGKGGAELLNQGILHGRRALELDPHSLDGALAMADLYLLTSNFSEAKKMAEAARKVDPQNPWAAYFLWKASDPENPESPLLNPALAGKPTMALAYLDQGHAFLRRGEAEKAKQVSGMMPIRKNKSVNRT